MFFYINFINSVIFDKSNYISVTEVGSRMSQIITGSLCLRCCSRIDKNWFSTIKKNSNVTK